MFRKLLATTAAVALLSSGAIAAETPTATKMMEGKPLFSYETEGSMTSETGYFEADGNQILASQILGETVYSGEGEDAEAIGDVNDVVMGPNGIAEAVVIGVGGFLGIGEKDVAVDFEKIAWIDRDGDRRLILPTTKEDLEGAPQFDRSAFVVDDAGRPATTAMNDSAGNMADPVMKQDGTVATNDAAGQDTDAVDRDNRTAAVASGEGWSAVMTGELSAEELIGTRVYGANENDLGEIGDVIVSADGNVEAYVIDVGGFLGIGEKPVALDATDLEIMRNGSGDLRIVTAFTEEQLEGQAAYTKEAYEADRDSVLMR